jgi:hypothetical protein
MTLLGESPDVTLEVFTRLLLATLQVLGVPGTHIHALEILCEDLLEVLPTIDRVSQQVVQLGTSRVSEVNGEELDDEHVIIHPAHPTHEAVVFQPNVGHTHCF